MHELHVLTYLEVHDVIMTVYTVYKFDLHAYGNDQFSQNHSIIIATFKWDTQSYTNVYKGAPFIDVTSPIMVLVQ